jgi:anti-sigma factor RsiW
MNWHVPDDELVAYAVGRASPPGLWSTETHLEACARCREALARFADAKTVDGGWDRLDARLDEPRRGPVESVLVAVGVPEHTARLLAATPALRLPWLVAVALTLVSTAAGAHLAQSMSTPLVFLAAAPLLPLAGVAVSFGPGLDPTYELTLVAPVDTFRLVLLRAVTVLATTITLSAVASLALPDVGLLALAWMLPALALTLLGLALTPSLGPVVASALAGLAWLAALTVTVSGSTGASVLFGPAGQLAAAAVGLAAAIAVLLVRGHFDTSRSFDPAPRFGARRLS